MSCRGNAMPAQVLAPDSKCKSNISSFLTLLHPLKCHLCQWYHDHYVFTANDGVWKGWGWLIYVRVWDRGTRWWLLFFFSYFVFSFYFVNCSFMTHAWWLLCLFLCSFLLFFFFLSLVPLIRHYTGIKTDVFVL